MSEHVPFDDKHAAYSRPRRSEVTPKERMRRAQANSGKYRKSIKISLKEPPWTATTKMKSES